MIRLDQYFDADFAIRGEDELRALLEDQEAERRLVTFSITHDLAGFGKGEGFNANQTRGVIEALFATYAAEWSIYILVGSSALADAITADTTLNWLNTDAGGQTIRTRIVNRLT